LVIWNFTYSSKYLPAIPRDAITKCLLSSRARNFRRSLDYIDNRDPMQGVRTWKGSPGGILPRWMKSSSPSHVVVRERRLPAATHVDLKLFRGFPSQHFRLGLFVQFKGNVVQPEAIRSKGGFEFHLLLFYDVLDLIRNPFPSGESRVPLKGDPTSIDCREKLIRTFLPLRTRNTLPRRQLYWVNQNITFGCDICDSENDTDCLLYILIY